MVGQIAIAGQLQSLAVEVGPDIRGPAGRQLFGAEQPGGHDRTPFLRRGPVLDLLVGAAMGIEPGGAVADRVHAREIGGAGVIAADRPWLAGRAGPPFSSSPEPTSQPTAGAAPMPRTTVAAGTGSTPSSRTSSPLGVGSTDAQDPGIGTHGDAVGGVQRGDSIRVRPQCAPQRHIVGDEDSDLAAELAGGRGHLGTDEAAADDRDGLGRSRRPGAGPRAGPSRRRWCAAGAPRAARRPGRSQRAAAPVARTTASASTVASSDSSTVAPPTGFGLQGRWRAHRDAR